MGPIKWNILMFVSLILITIPVISGIAQTTPEEETETTSDETSSDEATTDEPTSDEPETDESTSGEAETDETTSEEPETEETATEEAESDETTADEPETDETMPADTTPADSTTEEMLTPGTIVIEITARPKKTEPTAEGGTTESFMANEDAEKDQSHDNTHKTKESKEEYEENVQESKGSKEESGDHPQEPNENKDEPNEPNHESNGNEDDSKNHKPDSSDAGDMQLDPEQMEEIEKLDNDLKKFKEEWDNLYNQLKKTSKGRFESNEYGSGKDQKGKESSTLPGSPASTEAPFKEPGEKNGEPTTPGDFDGKLDNKNERCDEGNKCDPCGGCEGGDCGGCEGNSCKKPCRPCGEKCGSSGNCGECEEAEPTEEPEVPENPEPAEPPAWEELCEKKGEVFDPCGTFDKCERTCKYPNGRVHKCPIACVPRCVCPVGMVRRGLDKQCVPIDQCPHKWRPRIPEKEPRIPPRRRRPWGRGGNKIKINVITPDERCVNGKCWPHPGRRQPSQKEPYGGTNIDIPSHKIPSRKRRPWGRKLPYGESGVDIPPPRIPSRRRRPWGRGGRIHYGGHRIISPTRHMSRIRGYKRKIKIITPNKICINGKCRPRIRPRQPSRMRKIKVISPNERCANGKCWPHVRPRQPNRREYYKGSGVPYRPHNRLILRKHSDKRRRYNESGIPQAQNRLILRKHSDSDRKK